MRQDHHLVILPDDAGDSIECPHGDRDDAPCGLRELDGPDMDVAINRYGMIVLDSWPPGDFPLLPPGVDDAWDEEWQVVYDDLRFSVDFEEWHAPTGGCAVVEAFFAGCIDGDVPKTPGRYLISWECEGDFEDWSIVATFTEAPR